MSFKDYFSKQAREYSKYRPRYPSELFDFISSHALKKDQAWDCATGSGQAALELALRFKRVVATDASSEQIENAEKHPGISYQVAPAEQSGLKSGDFDLVTVATAAHWFDLDRFYTEVKRVLHPGGVLAIWTYGGTEPATKPEVAQVLQRYAREIVGPFFAPELQRAWDGYSSLPFPFQEIQAPSFSIRVEWDVNQVLGYLATWSATQRYVEQHDSDPRDLIREDLLAAWGDPKQKIIREWKLGLRIGRFEI